MLPPTAETERERGRPLHRTDYANEQRRIFGLLIFGFALITVLLGLDAWVGYHGAASVRTDVSALTENQLLSVALIDQVQEVQSALSSIQYRLPAASSVSQREGLKNDEKSVEKALRDLFARIPPSDPEIEIWNEIRKGSLFGDGGRGSDSAIPRPHGAGVVADDRGSPTLIVGGAANSFNRTRQRATTNRQQIERATQQQSLEDRGLLLACLIVACVFLRTAVRIYRRMSEQTAELGRVSWQLLEKQESLARRLSRDLHDELGQNLTALKTNFSRHSSSSCVDAAWIQDCTLLLKNRFETLTRSPSFYGRRCSMISVWIRLWLGFAKGSRSGTKFVSATFPTSGGDLMSKPKLTYSASHRKP